MPRKMEIKTVFKAVDRMSKPLRRMQNRVGRFSRRMKASLKGVNKLSNKLIRGFGGIAKAAGKIALGGVVALGVGVGYLVKQFSKVEDAEAAFTPLLGGAKKAKDMVAALNATAATTPFQLETLSTAAKLLLPTMGGDIKKTVKTLRQLGDTAGGNAVKFESIASAYSKMAIKGKVYLGGLNMMANAGIPIFTELAKSMGTKANDKFFKQISAGKIKIDALNKAFADMTSEGGIFFKGMEIASQTTSGVFSTMKDNLELTAAALGETLAPVIKDVMGKVIEVASKMRLWIAENQDLIKSRVAVIVEKVKVAITGLIEGIKNLLTNKDALDGFWGVIERVGGAISWMVENAKGIGIVIGIIASLIAIVKILTAVLTVINLVMAANPVVLITLGIIALIAALTAVFIKFKIFEKIMGVLKEVPGVIKTAWEGLKTFFTDLWDSIVKTVRKGVDKVTGFVGPVINAVSSFFGGGEDEGAAMAGAGGGGGIGVVSREERTAKMFSETHKSSKAEVTIRDESGRASLTRGELGQGVTLDRTGSY